jgi:hypothetical protein
MIVSDTIVKTYTGMTTTEYSNQGTYIHAGVEQAIKNYCGKTFESATLTNELYDGTGEERLWLKQRPINAITRVSIREACIEIKNTKTDATMASVKIDATNVVLTVIGGTGANVTTLAISGYATLTLLVSAINALSAYGWVAQLYDTDFASHLTTNLIPQYVTCTSWAGVTSAYNYIDMGGVPIDVRWDAQGWIESEGGFPEGTQNIVVSYTAGTAPSNVIEAILEWVKSKWSAFGSDSEGIKRYTTGQLTVEYFDQTNGSDIPENIKQLLSGVDMVIAFG